MLREGRTLPERIRNAPELQLGLELYYRAFLDLSSCRFIGLEEGPISWLSILTYCKEHGIRGEQREDMFYLIRSMDNAYFEYKVKKHGKSKGSR